MTVRGAISAVVNGVLQLMSEVDPQGGWRAAAEDRLRRQLDAQGLELPYRRPRAAVSRRAILRALVELLDAGRLDEQRMTIVREVVRVVDTDLLLTEPGARPPDVPAVRGVKDFSRRESAWLDGATVAGSDVLPLVPGRRVLAAATTLQGLQWGRPTEARFSVVRREVDDIDSQHFFEVVHNRFVSDYRRPGGGTLDAPLITTNFAYGFDSPAHDWLAINPDVARGLGWQLTGDGLFRWVNDDGEIMVESRWWMDGLLGLPPHEEEEVGGGWLVTASDDAWELLTREWDDAPVRTILVTRSFLDDTGRELRSEATLKEVV